MYDGSGRNNKRTIVTVLAVRMQCFRIPLARRGILDKVQNERRSSLFRYQPRKGVHDERASFSLEHSSNATG